MVAIEESTIRLSRSCFSFTILSNIQEAKQEILVASGFITDKDIIDNLGKRAAEGVKVKVVVSDKKTTF